MVLAEQVDSFVYLPHCPQDGDVYRGLLEMAAPSPLNATQEGPAWEGVLKPVLAGQGPRSRL